MDEPSTPPADPDTAESDSAEPDTTEPTEPAEPKRRRRWVLPVALAPVVILVVLIIGWAVDTSSGGVARNVQLAGADVGQLSEAELEARVKALAADFATVPVEIVVTDPAGAERPDAEESTGPDTYTTTAGELGLMIDQDRTVADALEVGDDAFVLLRPFAWVGSFLSEREAPVSYRVSSDQVATAAVALEGEDRIPATEPGVEQVDGVFRVVPGRAGIGIDPADVAAALPDAADQRSADGPIRIEITRHTLPPIGDDAAAEQAASGLEALVKDPVTITTSGGKRTIPATTVRTWATLSTGADGTVSADLDPATVDKDLKAAFRDVAGGPVDAHFTLEGGVPVIVPEQAGKICCGEGAAAKIIAALRAGSRSIELPLVDGFPTKTKAQLEGLGVKEEIGSPDVFGPTTEHKCCESRVQNIHRIADLIRGTVILPGETFSVNDHVGRRTTGKGFTTGGAIIDGSFGTTIGGGISQFATTLFNAALFGGLDFGEYQSHSLYITRYPRGREATLSFPHPDLQLKNNTPYGVMIWPTYTDTTITVHLYSTKHATVSVGEPTASPAGNCTKYTTPRTRTYPDGRVDRDTVFARYRPAEGVNC